jgi:hypothetical protein
MREMDMANSTHTSQKRVVVHFKDGNLLKGHTRDFAPGTNAFTVISGQGEDGGKTREVRITDLKAVFFVRQLDGNILYREKKRFKEVTRSHLRGHRIELRFQDGEVIRGTTLDYAVGKEGFFITPVDPMSNNRLIYVVTDALSDVKFASEVLH